MKTLYIIFYFIIIVTESFYCQKIVQLSKNQISSGKIVYSESAKDTNEIKYRSNFFKQSKIYLKNETKNNELNFKGDISISKDPLLVIVRFIDVTLKDMKNDDFGFYVNDSVIARTDTSSNLAKNDFKVDLKPSLDATKAQKVDINWDRKLSESISNGLATSFELNAKCAFSTKPDSASLNSIQFKTGYNLIWTNVGLFKYMGLSGQIGSEHPQDFSETNLVGNIVLSSVIPWTDILARFITSNKINSSLGILVQPAINFVKNTSVKDSSYIRGAIHCNWDLPLIKNQYIHIYSVVYFQNGYRPRSYIEMTLSQDISSSLAIIGKWVNGELPPLFTREVDFRIGLQFK